MGELYEQVHLLKHQNWQLTNDWNIYLYPASYCIVEAGYWHGFFWSFFLFKASCTGVLTTVKVW